jgi:hypothetical protein
MQNLKAAYFVLVVLFGLLFPIIPVLAEDTCGDKQITPPAQGLLQSIHVGRLGDMVSHQEQHSEQDEDATAMPERIPLADMSAAQISVEAGGYAHKALANPIKAHWPGTCTHTQWESSPWWRVNFKQPMIISAVQLASRDSNGDRLRHLNITVDDKVCASDITVGVSENVVVPCKGTGAQIKVQSSDTGFMTLCGFAAFGILAEDLPTKNEEKPCEVIPMYNSDFLQGTYVIDKPGTYVLQEDVVFEPITPNHMPLPNCTKYTQDNGYWLGFFAAIAVTANDVVIDLNKFSIGMSKKFLAFQRFFTVIQLGSKPFLFG